MSEVNPWWMFVLAWSFGTLIGTVTGVWLGNWIWEAWGDQIDMLLTRLHL